MSTWTNEKHERSQVLAGWLTSPGNDTKEMLGEALVEINRLRALTTITDDMVTAARKTMDDHWDIPMPYSWECKCGMTVEGTDGRAQAVILSHVARTALEAALNPQENES